MLDPEAGPPDPEPSPPAAAGRAHVTGQERDLLCALAYVHLTSGESARSVALLRLVDDETSRDVGFLRLLAYALIADGRGEEALGVLDRLDALESQPQSRMFITLLRSHALHGSGALDDAQEQFRLYVALRGTAARRNGLPPKDPQ